MMQYVKAVSATEVELPIKCALDEATAIGLWGDNESGINYIHLDVPDNFDTLCADANLNAGALQLDATLVANAQTETDKGQAWTNAVTNWIDNGTMTDDTKRQDGSHAAHRVATAP